MNPDVLNHRYAQCCTEPSDINEHLPTFVSAIDELNATRVIELGVRYGVSTIGWLYGLHGKGHLWSVDCAFPGPRPPDPVLRAAAEEISLLDPQGVDGIGVIDYWTFILGYDTWPAVLDALPTEADIIFLDTNHVYAETLIELDLYGPRVRKGGRMYLHDTALTETIGDPVAFPVRTAMEEWCDVHDLSYTDNPNNSGLGTIYF